MNLTFKTNDADGSYYTVTTEKAGYGYKLTHYTPASEGSKKAFNQYSLFYANLEQVAQKVLFLNLDGHNMDEILSSYNEMIIKIKETLEKN